MDWLFYCVSLLAIGIITFAAGYKLAMYTSKDEAIGTLKIDSSDPDDGPYLFLELKKNPNDVIGDKKYVTLEVDTTGYISQK